MAGERFGHRLPVVAASKNQAAIGINPSLAPNKANMLTLSMLTSFLLARVND